MAFDKSHLAAMVNADGQTWWQYKFTADTKATIDTTGYFNDVANMLKVNDLMFVIASDGWGFFVVNANDGTTVDITDGTAVGATDID